MSRPDRTRLLELMDEQKARASEDGFQIWVGAACSLFDAALVNMANIHGELEGEAG